jgi:uncharacterized membrane-anchored protein
MAELGRRSPDVRIEPVRHLLVFAGSSFSQVGRLVRRLHVLGEFRHAALLDYDNEDKVDLKKVSRTLRLLGREVDRVFTMSPATRIADLPALLKDMNRLQANAAETGVLYRIEQSRYYAGEFKRTLPHLRTVRVDDWQSYDDFVARYIYQLFARIDRVGTRYDGLMRRLSLLTTFSLATEIRSYQENVKDALGHLTEAARQLKTAAEQQVGVSEKQRSLLAEASFIALAFLCYYAGSVFRHGFPGGADGEHVPRWYDRSWIAVMAALSFLALALTGHRLWKAAAPRMRSWSRGKPFRRMAFRLRRRSPVATPHRPDGEEQGD